MSNSLIEFFKRRFTEGDRIRIEDSNDKLLIGEEYTVESVDDHGIIHCTDDSEHHVDINPHNNTFYKLDQQPMIGYGDDDGTEAVLTNAKEVAEFIMAHGRFGDVTIYTKDTDEYVLNTIGVFLDHIADMDYRTELLALLIPMQQSYAASLMGYGGQDDPEIDESPDEEIEMGNM